MKNLKKIRTEKGLSQMELSARVECYPNEISAYERGDYSPTLKRAKALAEALDVTIDDLIS